MKIRSLPVVLKTFCVIVCCSYALAMSQTPKQTKPHAGMLRWPDVSATHIVFTYANDLWIVPREGGPATPLSSPPGPETVATFSPDGKTVAFVGNYDGNRDIYTLPIEGGIANRVTYHSGNEILSDWTEDNRLVFAGTGYAGLSRQTQLFTVSPQGGLPQKLPVPYGINGVMSEDGRWLAYTPHSTDNATWKRYRGGMATDIWLFDLSGKKSKKITDWEGTDTQPMWHKQVVYYLSDAGPEHRLNIWRYDIRTGRREQVTKFKDWDIKWPSMGPGADGNGEIVYQYGSGLYLLDLKTNQSREVQVTIPGDRPTIRPRNVDVSRFITGWSISSTGKRAAIEARGDLWTSATKEGTPRNLTRTNGTAERSPSWSPDGRWIAYFSDATGEYELYVTQSDGKGETKQLTRNGNAFRYSPIWAPDSKHLTFTDKAGVLYLYSFDNGQVKEVDREPWGGYPDSSWSHDSKWIAYDKNDEKSRAACIWLYNLETGEKKQITGGMFNDYLPTFDRKGDYLYYVSSRSFNPTYEDLGTTWIYMGTQVLVAMPLRKEIKHPYLPKVDEETWKEEKKEEQPKTDAESINMIGSLALNRVTESAVSLQEDEVSGEWKGNVSGAGLPGGSLSVTMRLTKKADNSVTGTLESPLGSADISGTYNPGSKELLLTATVENIPITLRSTISGSKMTGTVEAMGQNFQLQAERVGGAPKAATPTAQEQPGKQEEVKKGEKELVIDFEGLEARSMALPVRSGRFGRLAMNDKNQLLFVRIGMPGSGEGSAIKLFDLNDEKREEKVVATGAAGFDISADGKKLLIVRGSSASIQDASAGAQGENVITTGMTTEIDPRVEWKQLFMDAWRIQRDFFYDPNMHGVDWKAIRDHYAQMLNDCISREDVSYVISEMISELNVGHAYYSGGDVEQQRGTSVGMLGVDFELANGAFRIAKIYEGAAWDTDARNPLRMSGINVKEGDYLLAVNGIPLDVKQDPYAAFQGLADRVVTLTVSEKPTMDKDGREINLRLLSDDSTLRYRAWIEHNRAYIAEKTGERVGYIYVPDTGINGQNDLVRQYWGQRGKDALIIDERWNGGGQIPTRFIELLNRPVTSYWARRDHQDWIWSPDSHQGPKCMLINGLAGSGGDAFPYFFRQAGLGKLIGTRTWGGLVGISGNPALIDGGYTSAPTFAFYETDGTWGIEGHGVDPDIEVLDDPALMVHGGDPQLDAAISHIMDELKRHPFVQPKRPPYPNRSGMGIKKEDK
jgi:tricorn protease-like protein/C-terminal processing protease CtpA/Prc